jgi:ketosteroid isomerase-like protein
MSQESLAIVQDAYAAFGRGDIPAILDALADDVAWELVGEEGAFPTFGKRRGKAGALAFFQALGGGQDFSVFSPDAFHVAGDTVFVQGHETFKVIATGKTVSTDWMHVFAVRDGKIAAFREFTDTGAILAAARP